MTRTLMLTVAMLAAACAPRATPTTRVDPPSSPWQALIEALRGTEGA